ncbi:MAG: DUF3783 domain-containing protein [Faecalicatena sp.]|uniref:DUF3783 domain-containing protein n=1 Tax=Faecalicatena sp. TaxID=2005360 RepID=UPI00258A192F|nr:DUF3783 domain-containing protein [Faecalicatena sp.]MCI6466613.1 DUF3783 domain-containing protein [Faecalicatena sp.]MDY5617988.1 DUF3783 domain-containing protein [Lachnospiraceae bacterium]
MKETILLFNVPDKETLLKIEMALFPLHVRLKKVALEDYNQPLGVLAGVKDAVRTEGNWTGDDLSDTMFVFAFFDDNRLNMALAALRKSGAGPFPYKAVLTPTNQFWTAHECFEEIRQEHEAMSSSN